MWVCYGTPMSAAEDFAQSCKACGKKQSPHQRRSSRPGKRLHVCVWPPSPSGGSASPRTQRCVQIGRTCCACGRPCSAIGKKALRFELDYPCLGKTHCACGQPCSATGKKGLRSEPGYPHPGKTHCAFAQPCSAIGKKVSQCGPRTSPAGAMAFRREKASGRTGKKRASRLLAFHCGHQSRPKSNCLATTRPPLDGSYSLTSPWATVALYSSASGLVKYCRLRPSLSSLKGLTS